MEYCSPLGLPHSKFLEWDASDRDKAISYMQWKKKFCPRCGTDPAEWLDERGRTVEPPPFVATTNVCHGCATLEEERATRPKSEATSQRFQTFLVRFTGDVEDWEHVR